MEAPHLVLVARDFKPLSLVLVANDCHIRQFNLIVEATGAGTHLSNGLDNSTHQNKQILKSASKRLFGAD